MDRRHVARLPHVLALAALLGPAGTLLGPAGTLLGPAGTLLGPAGTLLGPADAAGQAVPADPPDQDPPLHQAAADAVDRFVRAFNALGDAPLVDFDPERGFVRPAGTADSAIAAAFGSRARAFAYALGEAKFSEVDWLPEPWQYHGFGSGATLRAGHRSRITVLGRLVSGPFVFQRERHTWHTPNGLRGSSTASVVYQVQAGRIHRVWYPLAEPDPGRVPPVATPSHTPGRGPLVRMDVWHHNTATPEGTYWPLAELLRRDGYRVTSGDGPFTTAALDSTDILLVANARPAEGAPPGASAFTEAEVRAVRDWVLEGGSLLLVADHDPYAGAAADLAAAFGVRFHDGAARDTAVANGGNIMFRRRGGAVAPHPITDGRGEAERVDSVLTLLGQAFPPAPEVEPLLVLPPTAVLREPDGPDAEARGASIPVGGWLQAGARPFGRGRAAFVGEAWMFRDLELAQNARFGLNLMRWLSPADDSVSRDPTR